MARLPTEKIKTSIHKIMSEKKERKFVESIELQINLKDINLQIDKKVAGSVKLPNMPRPNLKICVIGDAEHIEEAKKIGNVDTIDQEALKNFNKENKLIKKWAKKYQILLCTKTILPKLNQILGPILNRINRFPLPITHDEALTKRLEEVRSSIRIQLKKVLCMGLAVARADMTEEQIRQNITVTLNFLVSLLKKGWQNIKGITIKTSMGKPVRII